MKREEETTHPCYKPVRKTKKHIAEEAKRFSFLYPSESKEMFFIYGAEWANKTMLDRACEWLKLRISVDVPIETNENGEPLADSWVKAQMERAKAVEEFITAFRQAMEGGAE